MTAKDGIISKNLIKDYIFTSLMILMEEKEFEEISITDITKKAGVSRMSYYRTYISKEDILVQYFNDLFESCLIKIKSTSCLNKPYLNSQVFRTFGENHILIKNMVKAKLYDLLLFHFIKYTTFLAQNLFQQDINDSRVIYHIYGDAGSLTVMLVHWIELGMKETPEEMAKLLNSNDCK